MAFGETIDKGTAVLTPAGYRAVVAFKPRDGFAIVRYTGDRPPGRSRATFPVARLRADSPADKGADARQRGA